MGFLLAVLLAPGTLVLIVLLVRYANWMRAHKDFRHMEDLRDRLASHHVDDSRDIVDLYSTYRRARFGRAFNKCRKKRDKITRR